MKKSTDTMPAAQNTPTNGAPETGRSVSRVTLLPIAGEPSGTRKVPTATMY